MDLRILSFAAFFICSVADLISCAKGNARGERIAKPFLMPLLLCYYVLSAPVPNPLLIAALVCGFLGDTFLLGSGARFLCGLASFLAGHLFYAAAFLQPLVLGAVPAAIWAAVPVYAGFAFAACRRLLPSVQKKLRPAIVTYMVCLLAMSFAALLRCGYASGAAFWMPFSGSLLFVASDTMLAFQIFQKKSGSGVMITYLLAQFLIVSGFLA